MSKQNMTVSNPSKSQKHSHPLSQFVWAGMLLLVLAFPSDAMAGNMLEKAIELVNKEREANGLSPVAENALLTKAAEAKADDMIKNDYFAHTSPIGETPWHWLKQAGYSYRAAGENLALNYDDAKEQHEAWMKSTTHRANILNGRFDEIGMATRHGKINGKNATITVQLFGSQRSAAFVKTSAPAKEIPEKAIQGAETKLEPVVVIQATPVLPVINPQTSTATVLVTPTLLETLQNSQFIANQAWFAWAELFLALIFFSVALAIPIVFIAEMSLKLRSLFRERQTT